METRDFSNSSLQGLFCQFFVEHRWGVTNRKVVRAGLTFSASNGVAKLECFSSPQNELVLLAQLNSNGTFIVLNKLYWHMTYITRYRYYNLIRDYYTKIKEDNSLRDYTAYKRKVKPIVLGQEVYTIENNEHSKTFFKDTLRRKGLENGN